MSLDDRVSISFDILNQKEATINIDPEMKDDISDSIAGRPKKRRGRPPKSEKEETKIALKLDETTRANAEKANLPFTIVNNEGPIIQSYDDTNVMLRGTIAQLDQLACEVKGQLDYVKASRTMKGKYKSVSDLAMTAGSLLTSKITAIRELNKTMTDCHNLELKRVKEIGGADDKTDEQRVMDMYNAYISMPVGQYNGPQFPNIADASTSQVGMVSMMPPGGMQNNFSMTPEMNRVMMGDDENIKTVVIYNPATMERHFEVVDVRTGAHVPNFPLPSSMVLDGLEIRESEGIAVHRELGMQFDLVMDAGTSFQQPQTQLNKF